MYVQREGKLEPPTATQILQSPNPNYRAPVDFSETLNRRRSSLTAFSNSSVELWDGSLGHRLRKNIEAVHEALRAARRTSTHPANQARERGGDIGGEVGKERARYVTMCS